MQKTCYFYFRTVDDGDIQDYVEVRLNGAVMSVFDLHSLDFVGWLSETLAKRTGIYYLSFMLNIPAFGTTMALNCCTDYNYVRVDDTFNFIPLCNDFMTEQDNINGFSSLSNIPYLLALMRNFFTKEQSKLCKL